MEGKFRFSLRTLLIVVAVAGITLGWFAYYEKWIRDRHTAALILKGYPTFTPFTGKEIHHPPRVLVLPLALRLLGEQPLEVVHCHDPSAETLEVVRALFPESEVIEVQYPDNLMAPQAVRFGTSPPKKNVLPERSLSGD